jgi:hypothetical protein
MMHGNMKIELMELGGVILTEEKRSTLDRYMSQYHYPT